MISEILLDFILNLIYLALGYLLFKTLYNRKSINPVRITITTAIALLMPVSSFFFRTVPSIKLLVVYLTFVVVYKMLFEVSWKQGLLISALFFGIMVSCELIVYISLGLLYELPEFQMLTNETGAFYIELLSEFLVFLIIIFAGVFLKRSNLSRMDVKGWLAFSIYPIFSVLVVILLVANADKVVLGQMGNIFLFIGVGLMVSNVLLFYLLDNVIGRELKMARNEELVRNADHVYEIYSSVSREKEIQKARTHDYINHLKVIQDLGRKGNLKAQEKYIDEQISEVSHSQDVFETGSPIVDAVINRKYLEAKEKGISFLVEADNLTDLSISSSDLVTILSNMLDNAIEAA
ncbi:MAG: hypothetical protein J5965_16215, partial [Aeriscardovia sp.]|nr:hypothetical protein [Aeriscardovia sp.]